MASKERYNHRDDGTMENHCHQYSMFILKAKKNFIEFIFEFFVKAKLRTHFYEQKKGSNNLSTAYVLFSN